MNRWLVTAGALALAASMAGYAQAADKIKACWVYVGPVGDFGYSYQHDVGRKQVEKELGDKVETTFVENVAEGPDADRAGAGLRTASDLAGGGCRGAGDHGADAGDGAAGARPGVVVPLPAGGHARARLRHGA